MFLCISFLFYCYGDLRDLHSFPTRRSSDLPAMLLALGLPLPRMLYVHGFVNIDSKKISKSLGNVIAPKDVVGRDRKSTRLNSSHTVISYAVFCLKKKKKKKIGNDYKHRNLT